MVLKNSMKTLQHPGYWPNLFLLVAIALAMLLIIKHHHAPHDGATSSPTQAIFSPDR